MRIIFTDGTVKEMPFDVNKMARLIKLSQKSDGNVGYRVELSPDRPLKERQRQVKQLERYIDWLDVNR